MEPLSGQPSPVPPVIRAAGVPGEKPAAVRQAMAIVLSLQLGLFCGTAVVSVLDDSLVLISGLQILTGLSVVLTFLSLALTCVIYLLMGLTPLVPKRIFLPMLLFYVGGLLVSMFLMIRYFRHALLIDWGFSLCQLAVGLGFVALAQGGWKIRWPLLPDHRLGARLFSWGNTLAFLLVNFFLALTAATALGYGASRAVQHFTGGFVSLRPSGIVMQARKYMNAEGKTVQLIPMQHIADAAFYREVTRACPSNAVVLMEGVTDEHHLLTNKLSYARAANKLGLVEQKRQFDPVQCQVVFADVDVSEFTTNTLSLLNLVILIHTQGLNRDTFAQLQQFSQIPANDRELQQMFDQERNIFGTFQADLLDKRNAHLLREFWKRLPEGNYFVIPWGAEHMQGIAPEIEQRGFHLVETREIVSVRFFGGNRDAAGKAEAAPVSQ
jgi:hypothetical protein